MPTTLYLKASGHPALRLCDPLVPCVTGYDPALMDWEGALQFIVDDASNDDAIQLDGWQDDAGIYPSPPPEPPVVETATYGGSYVPDPKRRKQLDDEERERRESLRRTIEAAWAKLNDEDSDEAQELVEMVSPAMAVPVGPVMPAIDWEALSGRMAAIQRAASEFEAARRAEEEEEEDMVALLMAA